MISRKPLSLRIAHKKYTRRRLLDAAVSEFRRRGVEETRIIDITQAAGAARGTFYQHFSSREELIRELLKPVFDITLLHYEAFSELPDWSRATVRAWLSR